MANQIWKNKNGVDHSGKSKNLGPGNPTLLVHHDANAARASDGATERASGNIARSGAPKAFHPTPIHSGMTQRQTDMLGMGHSIGSAPDASAANPLDTTVVGKHLSPPMAHRSMRSRINDTPHSGAPGENFARNKGAAAVDNFIGRQILAEAHSAPDDRSALAHLGVGSALPLTVKSK